jgi:hypothetical protein
MHTYTLPLPPSLLPDRYMYNTQHQLNDLKNIYLGMYKLKLVKLLSEEICELKILFHHVITFHMHNAKGNKHLETRGERGENTYIHI